MPRIKTTRMVRVALWALRIYLVLLLALIAVKFVRVLAGSDRHSGGTNSPTEARPSRQDSH